MQLEPRLRAFAAVARRGSFSLAAEELFVSQPAVSKHVAALERELGTRLVERGRRRGTGLTEPGRRLADYVLRAEALLSTARHALDADPESGVLAVAASGVPGTYLLPPVLASFADRHPRVELDLRISTSAGALELLRSHTAELAIVGGFSPSSELESAALVEDAVVLVGPPRLAARRLRPGELGALTWISRGEGSATRASLDVALWQVGVRPARRLELDSWEAVKRTVAAGIGVAAISRFAAEEELSAGRLVELDVPRWRVRRTISAVHVRDVPLSPPAERFLAALLAHFPGA